MSMDGQPQELQPNTIAIDVADLLMPTLDKLVHKSVQQAVKEALPNMAIYASKSLLEAQIEAAKAELRHEIKAQQAATVKPLDQRVVEVEQGVIQLRDTIDGLITTMAQRNREAEERHARMLADQDRFTKRWDEVLSQQGQNIESVQRNHEIMYVAVREWGGKIDNHDGLLDDSRERSILMKNAIDRNTERIEGNTKKLDAIEHKVDESDGKLDKVIQYIESRKALWQLGVSLFKGAIGMLPFGTRFAAGLGGVGLGGIVYKLIELLGG